MKPRITYPVIFMICSFILNGCSSGPGNVEKPDSRYKKRNVTVRNYELAEREAVKSRGIKSIEKIDFEFDSQGNPKRGTKMSGQVFDQNGFLIETITYDENGNSDYRFAYDYSSSGIRQATMRYDMKDVLISRYTYEYDEFGNKIKAVRYNAAGDMEKFYEYENDEEGNLVEETWYDTSGDVEYRIENEYENGKKIKSHTFDEDGNFIFEYNYVYDDQGNIVEELKLDEHGKKAGMIQYVYKYF